MRTPGNRNTSLLIKTFFATLLTILVSSCEDAQPVHKSQFLAFGTIMDLTLIGLPKEKSLQITEILEQDFQAMHAMWHAWDPGPVPRVNSMIAAGQTFAAPPSVLPLIKVSQELSSQSQGLFNPAVGQLIDLWGFQADEPQCQRPPSEAKIQQLVDANPQMSDLKINDFHVSSSNTSVKLDFGAIGKGYGLDAAIKRLRELGVDSAVINAGGDIRAIGSRAGHPWRIAIKGASGSGIAALVHVEGDESIFTSGNYERNFTWGGKIYHHIIDPRTGWPAQGTASVTVLHSDATTADAAATALFVAGPKQWHKIAKSMGIKYVMLIDTEGTIHMNPAMAKRADLQGSEQKVQISAPLI